MPISLHYTSGNHVHWVDMEWLWGYDVLPSSIRDMLHLCRETGVKGNVNFNAIGYEKLAAEAPEALAELRTAIQQGHIEVVGASYGHPYGLFHEGESNIRQRILGIRTVIRLFGIQPRTFWETALRLIDPVESGTVETERRLLVLHDGSQAFLRDEDCISHVLTMYDPWDEDYLYDQFDIRVRLMPHGRIDHAQRWKLAQEFTQPVICFFPQTNYPPRGQELHTLPLVFGYVWSDVNNIAVTAFYREMKLESIQYPYTIRLAEFNGQATKVRLRLPGNIADARKTNLLGDTITRLVPMLADPPMPTTEGLDTWSAVTVEVRPYEIATLYLDLELGRKLTRDLDLHRSVWATLHRT